MLTKEQVEKALPVTLKGAVTDQLVNQINNAVADPIVAEQIRDNFLSYTGVLKQGKFKAEDYLHAVMFVSYRLMGHSNQDAYFRTFPTRHAALVAKGTAAKDIAAYVSMYARGKLVNLILEQSLVPTWVLNQDLYQKALSTQADLMMNAKSEKVKCDAANSILAHLSKPKEAAGININMDMRENTGMSELTKALTDMAQMQRSLIGNGVTVKDIAATNIIEMEPVNNESD